MRPAITETPGCFCRYVPPPAKEELPPKKKGKQNKNNPHFHLADELQRITGVDLTRIDGVDVMVAQTLVSEVGLDMSRWKTEAHFASWLGLYLSNVEVWSALRRQRCSGLRPKKPPTTNRVRQKKSCPTRPTGHTSTSVNPSIKKFLESHALPDKWILVRFGLCNPAFK
jgi:hypothetical protein